MAIVKSTEKNNAYDYPQYKLNMRERKVLQVADQYVPASSSNWGSTAPSAQDTALDQLAATGVAQAQGLRIATVVYDFAVNGGAVSTIPLSLTLPAKAIIVDIIREEVTAATSTSSTGTIILNVATEGNLEQTALTCNGGTATVASTGGTAAPVKLAAARVVNAVIATNAILAGKIRWYIRYYQGE